MAGRNANLKSWKPGQSGNPGGRPKKRLLDSILAELLEDSDGANTLAIARAFVAKAKRGDLRACQLIAERTEGRPRQQLQIDGTVTSSDDRPRYDFSHLSGEQLHQLVELLQLAKTGTQAEIETNQSASEM